jgi:DNA-directed RNA polymerase subunit RPC12/RpoP
MIKCVRCGGEFLGGEPMCELNAKYDSGPWHIEYYCIPCMDEYSSALWNDEEWGPYPSRLQYRIDEGHA